MRDASGQSVGQKKIRYIATAIPSSTAPSKSLGVRDTKPFLLPESARAVPSEAEAWLITRGNAEVEKDMAYRGEIGST